MIDHIYLPVSDVERSREFYKAVLATLGIEEGFALHDSVVFGFAGPGALWIYPSQGRTTMDEDPCGMDPEVSGSPRLHIALRAETRAQVQDFYEAAVLMGAGVNNPPALYPVYHDRYFAAFIRDPNGHNIEAVTTSPT